MKEFTLENGLKVVYIPKSSSRVCHVSMVVNAGALYEGNVYPNGTAHFLEHMVFAGSQKYPTRKKLLALVEADGGFRNASTGFFHQRFFVSTLTDYIKNAFEYLSEVLFNPNLYLEDLVREKSVILSEFEKNDSDPNKKFYLHGVYASLFKNIILKNYTLGSYESIVSIKLDNIRDFHRNHFVTENMTLFIVGDFEIDILTKAVEEYFGVIESTNNTPAAIQNIEKQNQETLKLTFPGIKNTKISWSSFLSEISHKEYLSAVFLTRLLCYGTNSRLLVELRQKRGYIYSMWPGNEITPKGLVFSILTEAKDENLPEIKMIVRSTIEDIILNGVTVIELEALKKQHLQIVERSKDSTNELANLNVKYFAAFGIPFDSEAEELLVNNIEIDDIQSIADMLLKAGLSIAEMRSE